MPVWQFDETMVFPADGSLNRPEDGVILPDGRLIVGDQVHGLRQVEPDGRSAPFGTMVAAGYQHDPPARPGGANGVSLEPGGTHVIVADVFGGAIYRVNATTGAAERIYRHEYGVNAAVRDSKGTIWFTQCARNRPEDGEARLWAAIDKPLEEGAVYRQPMTDGRLATKAELVADSLVFANGIAIDEAAGHLYVAESMGARVLRFTIDPATGTVGPQSIFLDGIGADNIELDGHGRLWMAVPSINAVMVASTAGGPPQVVFQTLNPAQQKTVEEVGRRLKTGEPVLPLLTPDGWAPLPGVLTGLILDRDGRLAYFTGLGKALIRLQR